ncbi:MAG: hypothetical protein ACRD3W_11610, partial [Terriglobales bacterium]
MKRSSRIASPTAIVTLIAAFILQSPCFADDVRTSTATTALSNDVAVFRKQSNKADGLEKLACLLRDPAGVDPQQAVTTMHKLLVEFKSQLAELAQIQLVPLYCYLGLLENDARMFTQSKLHISEAIAACESIHPSSLDRQLRIRIFDSLYCISHDFPPDTKNDTIPQSTIQTIRMLALEFDVERRLTYCRVMQDACNYLRDQGQEDQAIELAKKTFNSINPTDIIFLSVKDVYSDLLRQSGRAEELSNIKTRIFDFYRRSYPQYIQELERSDARLEFFRSVGMIEQTNDLRLADELIEFGDLPHAVCHYSNALGQFEKNPPKLGNTDTNTLLRITSRLLVNHALPENTVDQFVQIYNWPYTTVQHLRYANPWDLSGLAVCLRACKTSDQYIEVEAMLKKVLAFREIKYGQTSKELLEVLDDLTGLYSLSSRGEEAELTQTRATAIATAVLSDDALVHRCRWLIEHEITAGRYEKARLLEDKLGQITFKVPSNRENISYAHRRIAEFYLQKQRLSDAARETVNAIDTAQHDCDFRLEPVQNRSTGKYTNIQLVAMLEKEQLFDAAESILNHMIAKQVDIRGEQNEIPNKSRLGLSEALLEHANAVRKTDPQNSLELRRQSQRIARLALKNL